jgi:hypothetical protein
MCDKCGERFSTKVRVKNHLIEKLLIKEKIKNENRKLRISLTRCATPEPKELHEKDVKVENGENVNCTHCERKFKSKFALMVHKLQAHKIKSEVFMCLKCPFEGKTMIERNHHVAKVHRKNYCEICDKTYNAKHEFLNHMKLHANANANTDQNKCKICGQECKNLIGLGIHLKVHERNPQWTKECKICSKKFKVSRQYKDHFRKVHESKFKSFFFFQFNNFFL